MSRAEGEKLVAAGLMLEGLQVAATGQQFDDKQWTFLMASGGNAWLLLMMCRAEG